MVLMKDAFQFRLLTQWRTLCDFARGSSNHFTIIGLNLDISYGIVLAIVT